MEEQAQEFIAKALRSLQVQIDFLSEVVVELKARIYSLEEESRWNMALGNIEPTPRDDLVTRLADGRLNFHPTEPPEEETEEEDRNDGSGSYL